MSGTRVQGQLSYYFAGCVPASDPVSLQGLQYSTWPGLGLMSPSRAGGKGSLCP